MQTRLGEGAIPESPWEIVLDSGLYSKAYPTKAAEEIG